MKYSSFDDIFSAVRARFEHARAAHPDFAQGRFHALGFLGEEYGEVTRELTKGLPGWEDRADSELIDLIVVASRMLLRHHEHGGFDYGTGSK